MIKAKTGDLRKSRILEGLSQTAVAKKINVKPGSYCMIENGKMGASPKTARAICTVLGKTFDDIFLLDMKKGA